MGAVRSLQQEANPLGLLETDLLAHKDHGPRQNKRGRSKKKASLASKRRRREEGYVSDKSEALLASITSSVAELAKSLPFTQGKNRLNFNIPPKAQEFLDAVANYKRVGFNISAKMLNSNMHGPIGFSYSLIQTLLWGYYLCPAKVLHPGEFDVKKIPRPTDTFSSVSVIPTGTRVETGHRDHHSRHHFCLSQVKGGHCLVFHARFRHGKPICQSRRLVSHCVLRCTSQDRVCHETSPHIRGFQKQQAGTHPVNGNHGRSLTAAASLPTTHTISKHIRKPPPTPRPTSFLS